jgi:hypothetical protein
MAALLRRISLLLVPFLAEAGSPWPLAQGAEASPKWITVAKGGQFIIASAPKVLT